MATPSALNRAGVSPFARAIEDFIIETNSKESEKSEFYKHVLAELNSGTVRRNLQEENARCAKRLTNLIREMQEKHGNSKFIRLSNRLESLCAGLNQFTSAFDVLIQAGPSAAVLIYGGARLVIHLAQNFNSLFDTIVGVLNDIGQDLQCYNLFAKAYCNSDEMQERLFTSYKRIITFWQELSKLLTKSTKTIFARTLIQPVTSKWQKCKDALRQDREAMQILAIAVDADLRSEKAKALEAETTESRRRDDLRKVAEWISPSHLDHDLDHLSEALKKASGRHPSTCQWMLKHPIYNDWLFARSSSLVIAGPPGVGKTIWSSAIVQDLEARNLKVANFSFSFNDSEQSNPMTAFRSIALRLLSFYEYVPDPVLELHRKNITGIRNIDTAISLVRALLKRIDRVHVVVDGLDECVGPRLSELLRSFKQLLELEPYGGITKYIPHTCCD